MLKIYIKIVFAIFMSVVAVTVNMSWLVFSAQADNFFPENKTTEIVYLAPHQLLTVTKTAIPIGFVQPGQVVTYSIVLYSPDGEEGQITINDPIPEFMTYQENSITEQTNSSAQVTSVDIDRTNLFWVISNIVSNTTITLSFSAKVNTDVLDGQVITNRVTQNEQPIATHVLTARAPQLHIAQTVTPTSIISGQQISYRLHYSNSGSLTATNVVIEDRLPHGLTNITTTLSLTEQTAEMLRWHVDAIPPMSEPAPIIVTATVSTGGLITNTVLISTPAKLFDTQIISSFVMAPAIHLMKTVSPQTVDIGQRVTYQYRITNMGNVSLNKVILVNEKAVPSIITIPHALDIDQVITESSHYVTKIGDYPEFTSTSTVTGFITTTSSLTETGFDVVADTEIVTVTFNEAKVYLPLLNKPLPAIGMQLNYSAAQDQASVDVINYRYEIINTGDTALTVTHLADSRAGEVTDAISKTIPASGIEGFSARYNIDSDDLPEEEGALFQIESSATVTVMDAFERTLQESAGPIVVEIPIAHLYIETRSTGPIDVTLTSIEKRWQYNCSIPDNERDFCANILPGEYRVEVQTSCGPLDDVVSFNAERDDERPFAIFCN